MEKCQPILENNSVRIIIELKVGKGYSNEQLTERNYVAV